MISDICSVRRLVQSAIRPQCKSIGIVRAPRLCQQNDAKRHWFKVQCDVLDALWTNQWYRVQAQVQGVQADPPMWKKSLKLAVEIFKLEKIFEIDHDFYM
jgi:hypothetical protein